MNQVSYNDLACHIKELSAADCSFFVDTRHRAESVFHEIDQVLSKIRNPNVTSNKELLEAMRTYFHLYRRAYTSLPDLCRSKARSKMTIVQSRRPQYRLWLRYDCFAVFRLRPLQISFTLFWQLLNALACW